MLSKSKWIPLGCILLVLNIVTIACSATPLNSNAKSITQSNKLVVLVQGIGSDLTNNDVSGSYGDTSGFNSIVNSLKATKDFASAKFMVYSYFLNGIDGQPYSYDCNLTYSQSLGLDELKLAAQITAYTTNHTNTDVYIISHSLGGVITFAFLADLVEHNHSLSLSNGGTLKGIAILDSPLVLLR